MNVSIVIPNYNGSENLKNNLPKVISSIAGFSGKKEIIIADDGSTDNSLEVLEQIVSQNIKNIEIKIVKNKINKGFSSNVNSGVKHAIYEYLVLLNTDVIPENNFLNTLLSNFSDEKVFGVGCMDRSIEGNEVINRGRGKARWNKGMFIHSAGDLEKEDTIWVSGGSSAFRRSIWDKLLGLDELYDPFYWEDIDLSYRALKSGYKLVFDKKSVVVHEHEKGAIKSKFKENFIKKISYRNQFIFIWKNADFTTLIFHIFWLPYHLLKSVKSGNSELLIGFIKALFLFPSIFKKRINSKVKYVNSDLDIVKAVI